MPPEPRHAVLLGAALVGVVRELGLLRFRLPQNARQIPREIFQRHPAGAAYGFGFQLGTGVCTYVSATAPYVVALTLLLGDIGIGGALAVGAGFGIGRALTPLARYFSGAGEAWDHRLAMRIRPITVGAAVAISAMLLIQMIG